MHYTRHLLLVCWFSLVLLACAAEEPLPDLLPEANPLAPTAGLGAPAALPATEEGVVTISFGAQASERTIYQPLLDTFMAANPDVRVQFVTLDLSRPGVPEAQLAAQIARAADVALIPTGRAALRDAAQMGLVRDLTSFMQTDASGVAQDYAPGMLDTATVHQGLYMLPRTVFLSGLLAYNKALWNQYGAASPQAQWTWRDIEAALAQIAATSQRAGQQPVYGLDDSFNILAVRYEALARGIDLAHMSLDQLQLDQPALVDTLAHVAELARDGVVSMPPIQPEPIFDLGLVQEQISAQHVAMWGYYAATPDLLPATMQIGVLPDPTPTRNASMDGYVISAGTQHPDLAWRVLAFLSAHDSVPSYTQHDIATVPARQSLAERTGYWTTLDDEATTTIQTMLQRSLAPLVDGPTLWGGGDDAFLTTAIRQVVDGTQSPEQALAAAQAELKQRLASAPPTPAVTPAPFAVNTPVPAPAPAATSIRFAAVGLNAAALPPLAAQFQQQHPELAVQLVDARAGGGLGFTQVAQQSDCFAYFQPPPPAAATAVADLQPRLDADASFPRGDYPPGVLAPLQQNGRLLGLPLRIGLPSLHANPAVFAAAGLPLPTAASNWADLAATAQQLTTGRGAQQTLGFGIVGDLGAGARGLLRAQGVALTSGDPPQPAFASPSVQAALPPLLDLLRPSLPLSATLDTLVAQGQVALWLDTRPATPLTTSTEVDQLVPLPQSSGAAMPVDVTSALFLSAQSQQPDACWTWLRWLADQSLPPAGDYPARVSQAQTASFAQQAPAGVADVYAAALPALQQPANGPPMVIDPLADDPLAARWFDQAVAKVLAGADLARALTDAQATTEAYLACVQGGSDGPTCARQVDPTFQGPGAGP